MEQARVRKDIPALKSMTYLDSAGAGLPPLSVTDAMKAIVDDWSRTGEHWEEWLLDVVECRERFGKLVRAKGREIGVVPSVSVALAAVASSIDFSRKKKVVVSSLNFPTNIILWQRMRERGILRGVEVLRHRNGVVPIEAYEKMIDDNTALVSIDYVSWLSGSREKVKHIAEIAHRRGALILVDAFHALGVFPFSVKKDGIDVLVSGFYKWLCGPHGVACIYTAENLLKGLDPAYLGWHGIEGNVIERLRGGRDPFDVPFSQSSAKPSRSAARFEWGTWATVAVKGAIEAMKFAVKNNPSWRFKIIRELKQELTAGLEKVGAKFLTPPLETNPGGGIVTFRAKKMEAVVAKLLKKKIIVSGRFGHVRVSPHFYNTGEEIERFLTAIHTIKE